MLSIPVRTVFCTDRPDFYITLSGKPTHLPSIVFEFADTEPFQSTNVILEYPFDRPLPLNPQKSAIISTICKNYSHRLEEWIQYNLKLGFSGIVVFNNDGNQQNRINEPTEHCIIERSTKEICEKFKNRVLLVDFPYSPFPQQHWNTIQRLSLHIGVNAFRNTCRFISLIDADEFIYLPKTPAKPVEEFLQDYTTSLCLKSNILTNKANNDRINNNVLDIARYVGEEKYTKVILHTGVLSENEFIVTPHSHASEIRMSKDDIIHYHCWINTRYPYNSSMKEITFLKDEDDDLPSIQVCKKRR
jgi:hypothetical protein